MKIAIICVMYQCAFDEAQTLQTLSQYNGSSIKLLIWNNGPKSINNSFTSSPIIKSLYNQEYKISFYEDLSNAPLSIIYNRLIDNNLDCDRFIILDHDTQITDSYVNAILNQPINVDLVLPHIIDEQTQQLVAPTDKGKVVIVSGNISLDKPGSVSSGLAISNRLVSIVKHYYKNTVFDEHFALYGIDSTFLMRIRRIAKKENIVAKCEGHLIHSLSLSLEENKEIKSFRNAELSYDKALTLRYYPSFGKLKSFLRDLKRIRKGDSLLKTRDIWRCIWNGKHPRCIEYKKNHFK